jgi:hypothetical protein
MGPRVGLFLILIIPKRTFGDLTNLCRVSNRKILQKNQKMKVSIILNNLVTQGRGTRNFTAKKSTKTKGPNPRTSVMTDNEYIDSLPLMRSKAK